jgi:hypothetical protein
MPTDNFNQNAAGRNTGQGVEDSKEVGANCKLEIPSGEEIPVNNVSFSEEAETSEVQYTTGFNKDIAVTGVTYSGSFEIPGNANNIRKLGWNDASSGQTNLPQNIDQLVIKDGTKTYTFVDVLLNSHSKDIPSDDRTTQSFDFMAQRLHSKDGGTA